MKSVFLIDDHPVVALGMKIALAGQISLQFIGSAADFESGLNAIKTNHPDCLVLDLVFDGTVVLSNVAIARRVLPRGKIVIFSSLPARLYERDALAAGADAFLGKDADMIKLASLIDGLAPTFPTKAIDHALPYLRNSITVDGVHLTPRELQVAAAISRGHSNDTIADQLALSPHTVAVHRDNMRKKLHCSNSKELAVRLALLSN